jgi:hypothetical protein
MRLVTYLVDRLGMLDIQALVYKYQPYMVSGRKS